jgi:YHS domain-containing protein
MAALLVIGGLTVFSGGSPEDSGQGIHVDGENIALKGADVVAYFGIPPEANAIYGKVEYSYEWKGATWLFATEETEERFRDNPEQYAPQYGGYCAYALSQNKLVGTDPDAWTIYNDKLYLNKNLKSRERWRKDKDGYIARADQYWPAHLEQLLSKAKK